MSAPTIAIIGAGGLGGPIARALAAAGCRLRIADFDRVELSNLQRQVQFTTADVGASKARVLADALGAVAIETRFEPSTAEEIVGDADAIVDGTDSPETKFAVTDLAVARGLPYVIASALRYGGNVFRGAPETACYRCLFEEPDGDAPTCADAGILGPVCACIGGLAARDILALVRGDRGDAGTILVVDDLRRGYRPRVVSFRPRAGCTCARLSA